MIVKLGDKTLSLIDRRSCAFVYRISLYLLVMLVGVALRTYVTHSVTVVWIVNLIGLFLLFGKYCRRLYVSALLRASIYLTCSVITMIINSQYLGGSLKALGTNVNILIPPICLLLLASIRMSKPFDDEQVEILLRLISFLGFVAVLFAWVSGYDDVLRAFQGRLNSYRALVAGFFYGKNIYGAFVSLTLGADLYLYNLKRSRKRAVLLGIKILAIIISFSRAALLQAAVMVFLFYWLNRKRSLKEWGLLIVLLLAFAAVVYSSDTVLSFLKNNVLRFNAGDSGRAFLRRWALSRVDVNFWAALFGIGFAGIDAMHVDIDNTYLYLFFSGGVIKCVFYLYFLRVFLQYVFALRRSNPRLGNLCLSVGLSYLVFAFFESVAVMELGLLNFLYTTFMFFIPIGYRSAEQQETENERI